jgi:type VI secretion system protein ImpH
MATEGRGEAALVSDAAAREALTRELLEHVHSFRFFQAVRLLARVRPERARVGRFGNPAEEVLRFGANPDLAFPAGEIQELTPSSGSAPWAMTVNFLGLVGHMGVLPHHYSTTVLERVKNRDYALRDFLDLFHHRLVALFYRAWERSHFYVAFERNEDDAVTGHLFDLVGLGSQATRGALGLDARDLLGYVGLLAPHQRSAGALRQILEDYFEAPVEIEQFVGGWYDASRTVQCRVDDADDEGFALGTGALVGGEVWDPAARARIVVGPLPLRRYRDFLPNGSAYKALQAITRFFSDDQVEFELRLVLEKEDVPPLTLGSDGDTPLGWSTWLRSTPFTHDASDTLLSL